MLPSNYLKLGWNPNYLASDKSGQSVDVASKEACKFSLWGSVVASWKNGHITAYDCEFLRDELIILIPNTYASVDAYDKGIYRNANEVINIMIEAEKIFTQDWGYTDI